MNPYIPMPSIDPVKRRMFKVSATVHHLADNVQTMKEMASTAGSSHQEHPNHLQDARILFRQVDQVFINLRAAKASLEHQEATIRQYQQDLMKRYTREDIEPTGTDCFKGCRAKGLECPKRCPEHPKWQCVCHWAGVRDA